MAEVKQFGGLSNYVTHLKKNPHHKLRRHLTREGLRTEIPCQQCQVRAAQNQPLIRLHLFLHQVKDTESLEMLSPAHDQQCATAV